MVECLYASILSEAFFWLLLVSVTLIPIAYRAGERRGAANKGGKILSFRK